MAKQYSEEEVVRRDNAVKAVDSLLSMMQTRGISPKEFLSSVKFAIGVLAISTTGIEHNLKTGSDEVEIEPHVETAKKLCSDAIEDAAEYSAFLTGQTSDE